MGAIIFGVQGLRNGRIVFEDESPASMATVVPGNLNDVHVADHRQNVSLDSNENEHWRCRALETDNVSLPPSLDILQIFRRANPGVCLEPVLYNTTSVPLTRQWQPSQLLLSAMRIIQAVAFCASLRPRLVPTVRYQIQEPIDKAEHLGTAAAAA